MPLRLPAQVRACLFDMDGVLTDTASVHASAWKQTFDEFLRRRPAGGEEDLRPFDAKEDYDSFVDGRSRADGTRAFLESRHIELPEGTDSDPSGAETIQGLSKRKNDLLLERLKQDGVKTFADAVRFAHAVREAGLAAAVVSASANTAQVLDSAGISDLFAVRIDGVVARARHLAGKPAPDMYLAGADALGVAPSQAAVFEDALAGVEAGRAGHFALVVGVDRVGQGRQLSEHGADVVVDDLTTLIESR
jgi:beta-phosphoglucomutase family hydrolase